VHDAVQLENQGHKIFIKIDSLLEFVVDHVFVRGSLLSVVLQKLVELVKLSRSQLIPYFHLLTVHCVRVLLHLLLMLLTRDLFFSFQRFHADQFKLIVKNLLVSLDNVVK